MTNRDPDFTELLKFLVAEGIHAPVAAPSRRRRRSSAWPSARRWRPSAAPGLADSRLRPGSSSASRNLVAAGFFTTPAGMKDLGYVGNVPLARFEGPPPELVRKVGRCVSGWARSDGRSSQWRGLRSAAGGGREQDRTPQTSCLPI